MKGQIAKYCGPWHEWLSKGIGQICGVEGEVYRTSHHGWMEKRLVQTKSCWWGWDGGCNRGCRIMLSYPTSKGTVEPLVGRGEKQDAGLDGPLI